MFDTIKDPEFGAFLSNFAHIAGAFFFLCAPLILLAAKALVHQTLVIIISTRRIVTMAIKMAMVDDDHDIDINDTYDDFKKKTMAMSR